MHPRRDGVVHRGLQLRQMAQLRIAGTALVASRETAVERAPLGSGRVRAESVHAIVITHVVTADHPFRSDCATPQHRFNRLVTVA